MVKVNIKHLGGLKATWLKGTHLLEVGKTVELPDETAAYLTSSGFGFDVVEGIVPPIVIRPATLKATALKAVKAAQEFRKEPSLALVDIPTLPKAAVAILTGKDAIVQARAGKLDEVAGAAAVAAKLLGLDELSAVLAKRAVDKGV